jgi:hypothetical protein
MVVVECLMEKLDQLITEAKEWHRFHKSRGRSGMLEAAAAVIRLRALEDAKAVLKGGSS